MSIALALLTAVAPASVPAALLIPVAPASVPAALLIPVAPASVPAALLILVAPASVPAASLPDGGTKARFEEPEIPTPLTLDQAEQIFLTHGLDLIIAEAQVAGAEGDLRAAHVVQNPTVNGDFLYGFPVNSSVAGNSFPAVPGWTVGSPTMPPSRTSWPASAGCASMSRAGPWKLPDTAATTRSGHC